MLLFLFEHPWHHPMLIISKRLLPTSALTRSSLCNLMKLIYGAFHNVSTPFLLVIAKQAFLWSLHSSSVQHVQSAYHGFGINSILYPGTAQGVSDDVSGMVFGSARVTSVYTFALNRSNALNFSIIHSFNDFPTEELRTLWVTELKSMKIPPIYDRNGRVHLWHPVKLLYRC